VKPANILVMGNGLEQAHKWQFKLADLGISHFKIKGPSRENSTASDTIGTRTYGT
jgi:serine/threonine protein kinase